MLRFKWGPSDALMGPGRLDWDLEGLEARMGIQRPIWDMEKQKWGLRRPEDGLARALET